MFVVSTIIVIKAINNISYKVLTLQTYLKLNIIWSLLKKTWTNNFIKKLKNEMFSNLEIKTLEIFNLNDMSRKCFVLLY